MLSTCGSDDENPRFLVGKYGNGWFIFANFLFGRSAAVGLLVAASRYLPAWSGLGDSRRVGSRRRRRRASGNARRDRAISSCSGLDSDFCFYLLAIADSVFFLQHVCYVADQALHQIVFRIASYGRRCDIA